MDTLTFGLLALVVVGLVAIVVLVALSLAFLRWMAMSKTAERDASDKLIGLVNVAILERIKAADTQREAVVLDASMRRAFEAMRRQKAQKPPQPVPQEEFLADPPAGAAVNGVPPWSQDHTDGLGPEKDF